MLTSALRQGLLSTASITRILARGANRPGAPEPSAPMAGRGASRARDVGRAHRRTRPRDEQGGNEIRDRSDSQVDSAHRRFRR